MCLILGMVTLMFRGYSESMPFSAVLDSRVNNYTDADVASAVLRLIFGFNRVCADVSGQQFIDMVYCVIGNGTERLSEIFIQIRPVQFCHINQII